MIASFMSSGMLLPAVAIGTLVLGVAFASREVARSMCAIKRFGDALHHKFQEHAIPSTGEAARAAIEEAFLRPIYGTPTEAGLRAAKAIREAMDTLDQSDLRFVLEIVDEEEGADLVITILEEGSALTR